MPLWVSRNLSTSSGASDSQDQAPQGHSSSTPYFVLHRCKGQGPRAKAVSKAVSKARRQQRPCMQRIEGNAASKAASVIIGI